MMIFIINIDIGLYARPSRQISSIGCGRIM